MSKGLIRNRTLAYSRKIVISYKGKNCEKVGQTQQDQAFMVKIISGRMDDILCPWYEIIRRSKRAIIFKKKFLLRKHDMGLIMR